MYSIYDRLNMKLLKHYYHDSDFYNNINIVDALKSKHQIYFTYFNNNC